jgi:hypothetical protein
MGWKLFARRNRFFLVAGAILVVGLVAGGLVLRAVGARVNKTYCASNLHQIGLAIILYQNDHGGQCPDSFAVLIEKENLTPACFICPAVNDTATPASGATTQAVLADFATPGHCSYRYTGDGLTDKTITGDTVLAFEPIENHGDGCNVLFGDFHADFVDKATALKITADADAHRRPIRCAVSHSPR